MKFIFFLELIFLISWNNSQAETNEQIYTLLYKNCLKKSTSAIDMNTTVDFCNCYASGASKAIINEPEDNLDLKLLKITDACKVKFVDGKGED